MTFLDKIQNKEIAIWGFGMEGKETLAVLDFLLQENLLHLPKVVVYNQTTVSKEDLSFTIGEKLASILSFVVTNNDRQLIYQSDFVFKSPGIALLNASKAEKAKTVCQTEWFMSICRNLVIGITGSKGKSTTTTLTHHFMASYFKTHLLGNIGKSVFSEYKSYHNLQANKTDKALDDNFVVELSSHQLEFMQTSPHVAIITNFYKEHLDHYDSEDAYYQAKLNISRYQTSKDYLIFSADNDLLVEYLQKLKIEKKEFPTTLAILLNPSLSKLQMVSQIFDQVVVVEKTKKENVTIQITSDLTLDFVKLPFSLAGFHHAVDLALALTACYCYAPSLFKSPFLEKFSDLVHNFKGLAHRLEFCGKFQDRLFYNDSIATIPESSILAIQTLEKVDWLLCGGLDRGIDYQSFADFLLTANLQGVICLPEAGERIAELLQAKVNNQQVLPRIFLVKNMQEAFLVLADFSKAGEVILLSPAASSYNQYKNFAERGDDFRKSIKIHFKN